MITPRRVRKGEDVTAELYNQLVDAVVQRTPLAGLNIRAKQMTGGVLISGAPSGGAAPATAAAPHPFHLEDASNPADGLRLRVYHGTVNNTSPTGMVPGSEMNPGDAPPFYISVSATGYVWLKVTTDTVGVMTECTIETGAAVPANTNTLFHLALGFYSVGTVTGVATVAGVADYATGSQTFVRVRNWFANPATYSAYWSVV